MSIINDLIGAPLGYILFWCYTLVTGYGFAILLFTLLTKIILFPLSLVAQKNSIKMVRMAPELDDIKRYNSGNGELIAQGIRELYKREKYSTVAGVVPLLVQIPIILGLINVIYNPLQHLLHLSPKLIAGLTARAYELLGEGEAAFSFAGQLLTLKEIKAAPEAFYGVPDAAAAIESAVSLNMEFFGLDLSLTPSLTAATVIIPILSGVSALALSLVQNKFNVLQQTASFFGRWGMTIFLVAFAAYFAAALPCGLGLYWTASNLLSIPILGVCNLIYNPKKYVDYEKVAQIHRDTPDERASKRARAKALAARSKKDMRRFFAGGNKREFVVYSEANGYYKYFKGYIEHILDGSDVTVHYVTSDPDDRIFDSAEARIKPYYINDKDLIALFMKMDADMFLMTTPDLDKYHLKRSLVRKDVEYIYTNHSMTSMHLVLREGAFDSFDTVFLCGPNNIDELRQTEFVYGLEQKRLVKTGSSVLDDLLLRVSSIKEENRGRRKILIAPSWQRDNLLDFCLAELIDGLSGKDLDIVIRPHPEFVKRFPNKLEKIREIYSERLGKDIVLETDFSSSESIYTSDVIVTDWSTIAQEYSYATKRPSVFVNTPMKVMNKNYGRIPAVPLDISLRSEIGVSVDVDDLASVGDVCEKLILEREDWRSRITKIVEEYIYNIGDGARNGAEYIIGRIKHIREAGAA